MSSGRGAGDDDENSSSGSLLGLSRKDEVA